MDARIYQLDTIRAQRNTRMFMERLWPMPLDSGGLALLTNAMSFWVEYGAAMVRFHHQLLSVACSPLLKQPKTSGRP